MAVTMTAMFVAPVSATASDRQIPSGYYNGLDGKSGAELKTAACNIIYNHTEVSSYNALPQYFQRTDVYPDTRRWWDMYADEPFYIPSFKGLNREHSFPKSWWGGSTEIPAYVDLNHLYPAEAAANQAKSNYPLGIVDRSTHASFDNGISTVGYPVSGQGGGAKFVFEPDDEYKGDFARTYFYMVTCYQNLTWKYTYMVSNNSYPTLNNWSQELLMKWHREDPVSQKEIDRNEVIYSIQANRNPFIDFPALAEYLWGNKKGDRFYLKDNDASNPGEDKTPVLITPVQGMELEFGEVALGKSSIARLHLRGENLTGKSVTLNIYDNASTSDANLFSIDGANKFNANVSSVNSADGLWVTVTYTPDSVGIHSTRLVISGGGIKGSVGIGLKGQCFPTPQLTAPLATAATDITSDGYTANWTPVDNEVVDYYIVNRTCYIGGTATTEQLIAEETSLRIDDFCGSESYTMQSVRLDVLSPQSNVIFVNTGSVTEIDATESLAVRYWPGGIRLAGADVITGLRVIDTTGRIIREIPESHNDDVILLPVGVYFITADKCAAPVKIVVRD